MNQTADRRRYRSTESKYKGGAHEMYVTYDLRQRTRGGSRATYPKVKRVYIAGDVKRWQVGDFTRRSGRQVHGVKIEYEQSRAGYTRQGYTAHRGSTEYHVPTTRVAGGTSSFSQIVEVPQNAENVLFRGEKLPEQYQDALQTIR